MQNLVPTPRPVPDFTPVPRRYRSDGWTAERQRAFIAALAETGSVTAAARRVNMAKEGAYQMRLKPEAESFRHAWAAALDHGVQTLTDLAIDRARDGVPVPVFHKGEQVGEKRWYNDRLLMFILKHHMPGKYGTAPLPPGTRARATIEREAAENCPICKKRAGEAEAKAQAAPDARAEDDRWLDEMIRRYAAKVRAERHHRLNGQIVAADFTLRQLTHIELILDMGGRSMELIDLWTREPGTSAGDGQLYASALSERLDHIRRAAWQKAGDPPRPPLDLRARSPGDWTEGGPTHTERHKARADAERRMAEAQREWEAAQREDSWEEWKAVGQN